MADLDVKKTAEAVAEFMGSYIEQFILILTKPRSAMEAEFAFGVLKTRRIQSALVYGTSSILLGICLAKFLGLSKSPTEVNPQTAVAVLFIWILSAAILHPVLRLFRAKGKLLDTVVVFLLTISTVHLVFVPILAILSRVITNTQVTLTYEYVVYIGAGGSDETWSHRGDIGRLLEANPNWRGYFRGKYSESYIKEEEPERDRTLLPPVRDVTSYNTAREIPQDPTSRERVNPAELAAKPPSRSETPVLREGAHNFLLVFWIFYYLINSAYLAAGLSVPHERSPYYLFSLPLVGPIVAGIVLLVAFFGYLALI